MAQTECFLLHRSGLTKALIGRRNERKQGPYVCWWHVLHNYPSDFSVSAAPHPSLENRGGGVARGFLFQGCRQTTPSCIFSTDCASPFFRKLGGEWPLLNISWVKSAPFRNEGEVAWSEDVWKGPAGPMCKTSGEVTGSAFFQEYRQATPSSIVRMIYARVLRAALSKSRGKWPEVQRIAPA